MNEDSPEVVTAIRATQLASALCQRIGKELAAKGSLVKSDRSPVTVADFGSQAVICKVLREAFPEDVIVAEEDSDELRKPGHSRMLEQVTRYVQDIFPEATPEKTCSWIDFSSHRTPDRYWTLDPIDGTKGFLRGDQYAIALALIEEDTVKLGIMACPNLYPRHNEPQDRRGCLFLALRKKGSFQMDLDGRSKRPLAVSAVADPSEASFTESVEPDHADHLLHQRVAKRLGISNPPLKMDSQAKYGVVARGDATLYLRVPSPSEPGYMEKIWDHAAGSIIAEEAGGKVTDVRGRPLDFSCGTTLEKNYGILVSNGILHDTVLEAIASG